MIQESINIIKLIAEKGHVITNGEIYGNPIYLGCNDSIDNWYQISQSEYDSIIREREEDNGC